MRRFWGIGVTTAVILLVIACGSDSLQRSTDCLDFSGGEAVPIPCPSETTSFPTSASIPEQYPPPIGAAVWSYLQEVGYSANWELWPGKGELFVGGEPHGQLHTVYVSPQGFESLLDRRGSMPNRTIVLKENYTVDRVLENVTIMYKVEGYNPLHNDWFWAMVGPDGQVRREGMVEGCQACHGARADNDYILVGDIN